MESGVKDEGFKRDNKIHGYRPIGVNYDYGASNRHYVSYKN